MCVHNLVLSSFSCQCQVYYQSILFFAHYHFPETIAANASETPKRRECRAGAGYLETNAESVVGISKLIIA